MTSGLAVPLFIAASCFAICSRNVGDEFTICSTKFHVAELNLNDMLANVGDDWILEVVDIIGYLKIRRTEKSAKHGIGPINLGSPADVLLIFEEPINK